MEEISEKLKLQISAAALELDRSTLLIDTAQVVFENSAKFGKIDSDALADLQNLDYASQIVKCVSSFLRIIAAEDQRSAPDLFPRDVALRVLSGGTSN